MICSLLCRITSASALSAGSRAVNEPYIRHDMQGLNVFDLADQHKGMDESISHMLFGGNGWARCADYSTPYGRGIEQEVRDMRALRFWQQSLENCLMDRRNGETA